MKLAAIVALALLVVVGAQQPFPCQDFTVPPPPKTIHDLHPAHVSIVLAMGDSITAAFAARGTLMESRDISWSAGVGTPTQLTMPYMINQYAAKAGTVLEGMSTESVLPNNITHLPHGDYHPATDHLNFAESSGAFHRNSGDEQWALLMQTIPKYSNFQSRWKVFTVWMAANDVCGECNGPMDLTAYLAKYNELLANISTVFTNTLVNVVTTMDLSNVARVQRADWFCKLEHKILNECGCIDKGNDQQLKQLDENIHAMNSASHTMVQQWQAKMVAQGRTDMAFVVQGFQEGIGATLDRSFLSNLDCFHPSDNGHQALAIGLWNSMLCVDGRDKKCGHSFQPHGMQAVCPTKDSVFYTGPDVVPAPGAQ